MPTSNGYVELKRSWNDGDKVEIKLPMRLAIEPLPKSANFVSVLYGPIVLAGKLGREGMTDADFRGQTIVPAKVTPLSRVPVIIAPSAEEVLRRIEPVAGRPLEFRLKGLTPSGKCTLAPFASLHDERYVVYWPLFRDEAGWKAYQDRADPSARSVKSWSKAAWTLSCRAIPTTSGSTSCTATRAATARRSAAHGATLSPAAGSSTN